MASLITSQFLSVNIVVGFKLLESNEAFTGLLYISDYEKVISHHIQYNKFEDALAKLQDQVCLSEL